MDRSDSKQRRSSELHWSRCLALAGLIASTAVHAQSTRLLFVDQDAHAASQANGGALFNLDLTAATTVWPDIELAADISAPALEFIERIVVSPLDGRIFFTDRRGEASDSSRVYVSDCGTGETSLLLEDSSLPGPFDLAALPDGRLVLSDRHADPSGLGLDGSGEGGHGALFWLDTASGTTLLLSDGTDHRNYPAAPRGTTVFEDPIAVVHDPLTDLLYVADRSADPLGMDYFGAIFSVDPADGSVELVASDWDFLSLVALGVRANGRLLLVDALLNDSIVWEVDPTDNDPEANHAELSLGSQHSYLEDIDVDGDGTVFLSDSGDFDQATSTWLADPMILRLDESVLDPENNKVRVNDSFAILTPIGIAVDPACSRPTAGLAVSVPLEGEVPDVAGQFNGSCTRPGWDLCPSYIVVGADLDLSWQAHVVPGFDTTRRLTLYEHSVATEDLRFRTSFGQLLVIAP